MESSTSFSSLSNSRLSSRMDTPIETNVKGRGRLTDLTPEQHSDSESSPIGSRSGTRMGLGSGDGKKKGRKSKHRDHSAPSTRNGKESKHPTSSKGKKKRRKSSQQDKSPRLTPRDNNNDSTPPMSARSDETVEVPEGDAVMQAEKEITEIARKLPRSMTYLQRKLVEMEAQIEKTHERAVLPFQVRRGQQERKQLREEIRRTEHVIQELRMMSSQMQDVLKLRETVKEETKKQMIEEIARLKKEKKEREADIRSGFINRISLLHLYWPWRQLVELGDTNVGLTFKEELDRGPRYRNVGIQNNIQSEMTEHQLHWLEEIAGREDTFRVHLNKLDALVEDLTDITDLLENALTCGVCGLLFEDPVLFWPCGHTFCFICFQSLMISPSLHRCPTCSSISSEGYVHNILVGESVAKWMFKDSGYGDLKGPMTSIRLHLSRFSRQHIQNRITQLREAIKVRTINDIRGKAEEMITISYRAY